MLPLPNPQQGPSLPPRLLSRRGSQSPQPPLQNMFSSHTGSFQSSQGHKKTLPYGSLSPARLQRRACVSIDRLQFGHCFGWTHAWRDNRHNIHWSWIRHLRLRQPPGHTRVVRVIQLPLKEMEGSAVLEPVPGRVFHSMTFAMPKHNSSSPLTGGGPQLPQSPYRAIPVSDADPVTGLFLPASRSVVCHSRPREHILYWHVPTALGYHCFLAV